ncbi:PKD domain-containing protein [Plebeiibacterium sediminum]|uniref:PKD domain-containing protein n=1 Tax=Plebeiibacterium sediminum TaxID=2992112 RepID=A0AAE3M7V1_9BACT|nr:PKD domain-containing protein [Plebeiobacterium sediminum]MCW3788876.1 PKD domain-containing protein [Plebeiobacterium sediminum]
MSNKSISQAQYRIDSRVLNLFVLIAIISVGVLSYQFYSYKPHAEVDFGVLGDNHKVNEMIKFENKTYGKHAFLWSFGDGTKVSVRRSPVHIYKEPGEYEVCLCVDNRDKKFLKVIVEKAYEEVQDVVMPLIVGPSTVFAGKKIMLTCPTSNVASYEWYVEGQKNSLGKEKQFNYVFKKPGYKNVFLIVNGESRYRVKKSIYVKQQKNNNVKGIVSEVEDDADEDKYIPETPDLYSRIDELKSQEEEAWLLPTDSELQVELVNILTKEGDLNDFVKYLNNGTDYKMVLVNQSYITFNELVKELKGNEFVIKEFSTLRNENKITKITIRYRIKRRFL